MKLEEYPDTILNKLVELINLTDEYTMKKFIQTGERINTISCFREDLVTVALATAEEILYPENTPLDEKELPETIKILEEKGIKILHV